VAQPGGLTSGFALYLVYCCKGGLHERIYSPSTGSLSHLHVAEDNTSHHSPLRVIDFWRQLLSVHIIVPAVGVHTFMTVSFS